MPRLIGLLATFKLVTTESESAGAATLAEYEKIFDEIDREPRRHLVVAEVDGKVVGTADLIVAANLSHHGLPWAVVENVVVEESMRRKGIATLLLKHLIDLAKQSGCYKITLSSNKKRAAAHRFYESLGFDQYGYGFRIYF